MRVTESLIRKNRLDRIKRNRSYEEEESTQTYREKGMERWSINQQQSVFASSLEEGLNRTESVFDQQAVFRTKEGKV